MKAIKKIFVILDPGTVHQPALRRALVVQEALDAVLYLYLPERESAVLDSPYVSPPLSLSLQQNYWEERRDWLTGLTEDLKQKGRRVESGFEVANDWQHKVVKAIADSECDLVMMAAHHHPWLDRLVHLHRDWYVLRNCVKPLWICKSAEMAASPRFLACAALGHGNEAAAMDETLLSTGSWLAQAMGGAVHLAHCLESASLVTDTLGTSVGAKPLPITVAELEEQHADALNHAALRHQVLPSRIHFRTGKVLSVIPEIAGDIEADCVVLGSVARHGIERLVLGSTVESILDLLPMDVLVVRPAPV